MVWRADNSPLYRSVEEFNRRTGEQKPEYCEKCDSCERNEKRGREIEPPPCPQPPPPPPCPRKPQSRSTRLPGRITGDRDTLLLIALIFLLWHEKADMKLIAALVYILLG